MSRSVLDIRVAATADEARAAWAGGYEPVECAFGSSSVVGPLELDHHGELAGRQPVCRQAHDLIRCSDVLPRASRQIVVTGPPDADASLCVSLLLDQVAEEEEKGDWATTLDQIVSLVAASDVGDWRDLSAEGRAGAIILAWHARQRARGAFPRSPEPIREDGFVADAADAAACDVHEAADAAAREAQSARWVAAVQDWAELLALPVGDGWLRTTESWLQAELHRELRDARDSEAERVRLAIHAAHEWEEIQFMRASRTLSGQCDLPEIVLISSPVMGADVWYAEHPTLRGYVAWIESAQRVSISLRPGTARVHTPDGDGLLSLITGDGLGLPGWGGRPEIIGSPRGVVMTREDAVRAAKLLASRVDEVTE